jgi:hypothetical protein
MKYRVRAYATFFGDIKYGVYKKCLIFWVPVKKFVSRREAVLFCKEKNK